VFVGFFYFKKSFVIAAGTAPSGNSDGLSVSSESCGTSKPHRQLGSGRRRASAV
jgi:hypothetical protein